MVCMNNFLGGNLEVSATQLEKFDLNNNKIVTKVDALALYNLLLS